NVSIKVSMPSLMVVDVEPVNSGPDTVHVPLSTIRLLKLRYVSPKMTPLPAAPEPPPTAFCRARVLLPPAPPSTVPVLANSRSWFSTAMSPAAPPPDSTHEPVSALYRLAPAPAPRDTLP